MLALASIALSAVAGAPLVVYRSTPDLDAAAAWLDGHVQPGEVILANWEVSNYLAPRTHGSVFGGHPVATLHPRDKQLLMASFFSHWGTHWGDLEFARRIGADWVVYGPAPGELNLPAARAAFESGAVRIFDLRENP